MNWLLWEGLAVPQKAQQRVTHEPAIPFLGICPRQLRTYIHIQTSIQIIEVFFIIAKKWKQHKCPSVDECGISKPWITQP